jgi:hypothetical protein
MFEEKREVSGRENGKWAHIPSHFPVFFNRRPAFKEHAEKCTIPHIVPAGLYLGKEHAGCMIPHMVPGKESG